MASSRLALAVTTPITIAAGAAMKAFSDFDDAMTASLSIYGKVTADMRSKMESTARAISERTRTTATEIAKGYGVLISAGFALEQSMQAVAVAEKFAVASFMELDTATTLLAQSQFALGLAFEDPIKNMRQMQRVADVLSMANAKAAGTIEQFARALASKGAPALRAANKSLEEGVAALMVYAERGRHAEIAGELLNVTLRELDTVSRKFAANWRRFGVAIYDSRGNMRKLWEILGDMEKRLAGMSPQAKAATLAFLGFTDLSSTAIKTLLGTSGRMKEFYDDLQNSAGKTSQIAADRLKSFASQLKITWNQIVGVGIDVGGILAPALGVVNEYLRHGIRLWKSLSDEQKKVLVYSTAVAALLAPAAKAANYMLKFGGFALGLLSVMSGHVTRNIKLAATSGVGILRAGLDAVEARAVKAGKAIKAAMNPGDGEKHGPDARPFFRQQKFDATRDLASRISQSGASLGLWAMQGASASFVKSASGVFRDMLPRMYRIAFNSGGWDVVWSRLRFKATAAIDSFTGHVRRSANLYRIAFNSGGMGMVWQKLKHDVDPVTSAVSRHARAVVAAINVYRIAAASGGMGMVWQKLKHDVGQLAPMYRIAFNSGGWKMVGAKLGHDMASGILTAARSAMSLMSPADQARVVRAWGKVREHGQDAWAGIGMAARREFARMRRGYADAVTWARGIPGRLRDYDRTPLASMGVEFRTLRGAILAAWTNSKAAVSAKLRDVKREILDVDPNVSREVRQRLRSTWSMMQADYALILKPAGQRASAWLRSLAPQKHDWAMLRHLVSQGIASVRKAAEPLTDVVAGNLGGARQRLVDLSMRRAELQQRRLALRSQAQAIESRRGGTSASRAAEAAPLHAESMAALAEIQQIEKQLARMQRLPRLVAPIARDIRKGVADVRDAFSGISLRGAAETLRRDIAKMKSDFGSAFAGPLDAIRRALSPFVQDIAKARADFREAFAGMFAGVGKTVRKDASRLWADLRETFSKSSMAGWLTDAKAAIKDAVSGLLSPLSSGAGPAEMLPAGLFGRMVATIRRDAAKFKSDVRAAFGGGLDVSWVLPAFRGVWGEIKRGAAEAARSTRLFDLEFARVAADIPTYMKQMRQAFNGFGRAVRVGALQIRNEFLGGMASKFKDQLSAMRQRWRDFTAGLKFAPAWNSDRLPYKLGEKLRGALNFVGDSMNLTSRVAGLLRKPLSTAQLEWNRRVFRPYIRPIWVPFKREWLRPVIAPVVKLAGAIAALSGLGGLIAGGWLAKKFVIRPAVFLGGALSGLLKFGAGAGIWLGSKFASGMLTAGAYIRRGMAVTFAKVTDLGVASARRISAGFGRIASAASNLAGSMAAFSRGAATETLNKFVSIGTLLPAVGGLVSSLASTPALLAAAGYAFVRFTDTGRKAFEAVASFAKPATDVIVKAFSGVKNALAGGDLALTWEITITGIQSATYEMLQSVYGDMDSTLGTFVNQVLKGDFAGAWNTVLLEIGAQFDSLWSSSLNVLGDFVKSAMGMWKSAVDGLTQMIMEADFTGHFSASAEAYAKDAEEALEKAKKQAADLKKGREAAVAAGEDPADIQAIDDAIKNIEETIAKGVRGSDFYLDQINKISGGMTSQVSNSVNESLKQIREEQAAIAEEGRQLAEKNREGSAAEVAKRREELAKRREFLNLAAADAAKKAKEQEEAAAEQLTGLKDNLDDFDGKTYNAHVGVTGETHAENLAKGFFQRISGMRDAFNRRKQGKVQLPAATRPAAQNIQVPAIPNVPMPKIPAVVGGDGAALMGDQAVRAAANVVGAGVASPIENALKEATEASKAADFALESAQDNLTRAAQRYTDALDAQNKAVGAQRESATKAAEEAAGAQRKAEKDLAEAQKTAEKRAAELAETKAAADKAREAAPTPGAAALPLGPTGDKAIDTMLKARGKLQDQMEKAQENANGRPIDLSRQRAQMEKIERNIRKRQVKLEGPLDKRMKIKPPENPLKGEAGIQVPDVPLPKFDVPDLGGGVFGADYLNQLHGGSEIPAPTPSPMPQSAVRLEGDAIAILERIANNTGKAPITLQQTEVA